MGKGDIEGSEALFSDVDAELKADQELICNFALGMKSSETKNLKIIDNKLMLWEQNGHNIILARRLSHNVTLCTSNGAAGTWYSMGISWNNSGKLLQQLKHDLEMANYVIVFDENRYYGDNGKIKLMEALQSVVKQFSDTIPIFDKVHGPGWGGAEEKDERQRAILALREYHEQIRKDVELRIIRCLELLPKAAKNARTDKTKIEAVINVLGEGKEYLTRIDSFVDVLREIKRQEARDG